MSKKIKDAGNAEKDEKFPLPVYDSEEDIYSKFKEVPLLSNIEEEGSPGNSLDVPGAELDNDGEEIGEEDEENNYYSIGGDNHNDLEEDDQY